jgi:proteasome lid subunit RPN8/RPN11
MISSIRATIRELVAPERHLTCSAKLWESGLKELKRRSGGYRESGAFLLGCQSDKGRRVSRFVFYDDLDLHCLDTGIVVFDGSGYGPLWKLCRETKLSVVADVHTHPGAPYQSSLDRDNPMIATSGHIALIVPNFAKRMVRQHEIGIYEYLGNHRWHDHSGRAARDFFYIGLWG